MLECTDLQIEIEDNIIPETVIYDFDIVINPGEIVGIVGESGSGKSMSAIAIAGLLSRKDMKKRGTILFEGENLLAMKRDKLREIQGDDIAVVFQEPMTSLNPLKTIGWQVEEALRLHTDMTPAMMRERTLEVLREVELPDVENLFDCYPHELSGGMRQRVMIAAALVCNPKLLIADEPTTALDVTIQAQIIELLKKINKNKGTAILFISHDLSLVKSLCSRVLVMNKGRVVEAGPVDEVFYNPKEEYTKNLIAAIPRFEKMNSYEPLADSKVVLELRNFSAGYRKIGTGRDKKINYIVKDASFIMSEGEILGLVGESGSGKTTLGKGILGMLKYTSGDMIHYTENPQMIFQDPYGSLNPGKTIGWILSEPLRINTKMTNEEMRAKVVNMLEIVGLDESYINRKPNALSGGQRQRVCIALSLMMNSKLIIADEPVSALDVTVEKQILELLVKLNKEMGISIIFISHDLKVVYEICNRVMVMKDGIIVEQGTDKDIYFSPKNDYTKQLLKSANLVD